MREARAHLFSNWKGVYGSLDFSGEELEKRLKGFPELYRRFLEKDLREKFGKHGFDYVISIGELNSSIIKILELNKADTINGFVIYSF